MIFRTVLLALALGGQAVTPTPAFFQSPYSLDDMRGKQAVVETTNGTFVMQLLPETAPTHVAFFMKQARDGGYTGTIFHRVVKYAVLQGGDPISRDPAKVADYGQGGFNQLRAESTAEKQTAGAVSTITFPNRPDSGGAQFFVAVTDQPRLDGQYTVFGRIVEGIEVVQHISAVEADAEERPRTRVEIKNITIRDTPPEPFVNDTKADLATYRAIVETSMGNMTLDLLADIAPETVRSFLRWAHAHIYDDILIHRVAENFVVQTGAIAYRRLPLTDAQRRLVHDLKPEFSGLPNVVGTVSIAHGDDPGSGNTSFFICTGQCRSLDGTYTAFARVTGGTDVLSAITRVPVDGETPRTQIWLKTIRIEKK